MKECCICGAYFDGYGNNPDPLGFRDTDRCCDACNDEYVIGARLYEMSGKRLTIDDKLRICLIAKGLIR